VRVPLLAKECTNKQGVKKLGRLLQPVLLVFSVSYKKPQLCKPLSVNTFRDKVSTKIDILSKQRLLCSYFLGRREEEKKFKKFIEDLHTRHCVQSFYVRLLLRINRLVQVYLHFIDEENLGFGELSHSLKTAQVVRGVLVSFLLLQQTPKIII
jgi:hypothetical protein